MRLPDVLWLALAVLLTVGKGGHAADDTIAQAEFFEKHVRPVLANRCFDCHSEDFAESGLRVDSLAGLLQGGTRGPALVPGHPDSSLIISAVKHSGQIFMPPKEKISQREIDALTNWIKAGAHWPGAEPVVPTESSTDDGPLFTEQERSFWAFRPPQQPDVPEVSNAGWVRNPIDAFILAGLEAAGLTPALQADKRTLIRRTTFDLIGLPPTPEEVEAFLADDSDDAFASLVERLLASPQYGVRWGRHWLDVARYADSNGLDENLAYANAYRYRDYVVDAFNADKPYDRFVQEQIAGDLLPCDEFEQRIAGIVATGFLSIGAKMLAEDDPVKMQMDIVDEQVDTVGRALMGLTLGCARCHDHKFDPIPTEDYYSLAGIFKSTQTMDTFTVVARWHERPLASEADIEREREQQQAIDDLQQAIDKLTEELKGLKEELQPAREDIEAQLAARRDELKHLQEAQLKLPRAMAVSEGTSENIPVHIRGSHVTLGDVVPRRFPRILAGDNAPSIGEDGSGRLELARWLTEPNHPLTSRVMVNRLWQWHFGEGLVRTPDNFGQLGERPTHPQLLDWLALQFVESGWSMKAMHRLIMGSSTYQMSTAYDAGAAAQDPENRLWWRRDRRRLEAEAIRDAILAVAGNLDLTMGGSLLPTANRAYVTSTASVNPVMYDKPRRSLYLPVVRSAVYEPFQAFDVADPSVLTGQRMNTTVAPQALFMMNSQLVADQTRILAERLLAEETGDDAARVDSLYQKALSRPVTAEESVRALDYICATRQSLESRGEPSDNANVLAWQSLCRVVIASNEFLYVE